MDYKVFLETIINRLQEQLGKDYNVQLISTPKNNRKDCMAVMVSRTSLGKIKTGKSVEMEGIYLDYMEGKTLEDCVNSLLPVFKTEETNGKRLSEVAEEVYNWEKVKGRVYPMLIGRKGNEDYLAGLLHRPFMDMEIIYYVTVDMNGENGNAKVTDSLGRHWGKTEEEIHTMAMENLDGTGYKLTGLAELVAQMGDAAAEEAMDSSMYVLLNESRCFGAAGILSEKVLQMCADRLKGDFYLLPSSVHEMIVVPVKREVSADDLKKMVTEINHEYVLPEERLCDDVFFCRYDERKIRKAA